MNDDTSMNSPDLDPLHELASAHLDGATSADERAQVQASPELTALVDSFAALRTELADVPPVAATVRDAGIAAALAHFDELRADGAGATAVAASASAPVVQLDARRRWPTWVMSAAAGLALLGAVGIGVLGSGGSDSESSATQAAKDADLSIAREAGADTMAASESVPASTIGNIFSAGDVALVIESPEQLLELPLPGEVTYDVENDGGTGSGGAESTMVASETVSPEMAPTEVSGRPALACLTETQVYLADILFMDELAIAARDTVSGITVAITDDCTVLVAVGP